MNAGTRSDGGGFNFGEHAPRTHSGPARTPDRHALEVVRPRHVRDPLGTVRRRPVVEGIDVGQEHQGVCPDKVGDEGSEPVVVAEPDFVRGDRIVFVDNRHHPKVQEPIERPEGVDVLAATHKVVSGQQHLAHGDPMGTEGLRVARHQ
jgi:hypothetical protein